MGERVTHTGRDGRRELTSTDSRCDLGVTHGAFYWGDSLKLMEKIPDSTVDAVICSPPFEGTRPIPDQDRIGAAFLKWLLPFFEQFRRVLKPTGSVAFELGGIWLSDAAGKAVQHAAAIHHLGAIGWTLIQDFFYYNPQLLVPEPDGATRAADSITPIWVMATSYNARYNVAALQNPERREFVRGNLLEFDTSGRHDRAYERAVVRANLTPYADRWPTAVPELFVDLLTTPGSLVIDPFAGTGATCFAAERLGRRWIGIELNQELDAHVKAMFGKDR